MIWFPITFEDNCVSACFVCLHRFALHFTTNLSPLSHKEKRLSTSVLLRNHLLPPSVLTRDLSSQICLKPSPLDVFLHFLTKQIPSKCRSLESKWKSKVMKYFPTPLLLLFQNREYGLLTSTPSSWGAENQCVAYVSPYAIVPVSPERCRRNVMPMYFIATLDLYYALSCV